MKEVGWGWYSFSHPVFNEIGIGSVKQSEFNCCFDELQTKQESSEICASSALVFHSSQQSIWSEIVSDVICPLPKLITQNVFCLQQTKALIVLTFFLSQQ